MIAVTGCEESDERLARFAEESTRQQAEQNREMAQLNREVSQAHQELVNLQHDLEEQQAQVNRQRDQLESERREVAKQRHRDPIIAAAINSVGLVLACLIAPRPGDPRFRGVFHFIQDFQGYISPGILAAFIFGLFVRKAPRSAGLTALLLNVPVYGILHLDAFDTVNFLNKMAITFTVIIVAMSLLTRFKPLDRPVTLPVREDLDTTPASSVLWLGGAVVVSVLTLYLIFR
jgi:uncharacterized sodium:solute symporter family permease YidK